MHFFVYSDVVGQAFYFRPDNCRMVLGQLPRAFRTHLDVPESPWNPGVWGWKTPKKVDWHFVRFRCGICPLMNRALSIFRAALRIFYRVFCILGGRGSWILDGFTWSGQCDSLTGCQPGPYFRLWRQQGWQITLPEDPCQPIQDPRAYEPLRMQ